MMDQDLCMSDLCATPTFHPRLDENGQRLELSDPCKPTPLDSWLDPGAIATVIPDGPMPASVNGIRVTRWKGSWPEADWMALGAVIDEPTPPASVTAAGALIIEPDQRIWLITPSNRYGGYHYTFPKGRSDGLPLQVTAIKEVFEETGLMVTLTGFLADSPRKTSDCRFYTARRLAGSPSAMDWEVQGVHLAPIERAKALLNHPADQVLARKLTKQF